MENQKLPPHNIDIEKSILSSILINSDSIDDVDLLPWDFYKPAHTSIFQAMVDLQNKNIEIEITSVMERLIEVGSIESAGGAAYLSSLLDIPISVNIEHFSNKIKQYSKLRELIEISSRAISNCYDLSQTPTNIIENVQREISNLNTEKVGSTSIKDILNETIEQIEELKDSEGLLSGVGTGFRALDGHTSGLQDADFILVGARPSMGKTAFAMNIVRHAATMLDPVLVFSLEMPRHHLTHRLLAEMASVDTKKFRKGNFTDGEWSRVNKASGQLYELPLYIVDNPGLNINQILSISRSFHRKHRIKMIMIDYIQLIQGWTKEGQGPKAEISRSIKLLAKSLNIPVLALSQLNRSLESRPVGQRRPVMSDLREAGALEQDADIIAFLYRHEVYETQAEKDSGVNKGKAELLIRKNRQGSIGKIDLHFTPEFTKFSNVEVY